VTLERELRWLNGRISLEAKGLPTAGATTGLSNEPIRKLLTLLGDPHLDAPAIHITGTNGKGSTAHLISLILREHGLRVGTYGSPHVSAINERIQLDVEPISDEVFADSLEVVRVAAEHGEIDDASWFDLMTAAAFRTFSDAAVDVMVIEVGMLGRYDSTNVIDGQVAVVTNIGKDHTDGADGWREKIASEKAGIVKPTSTLVLGDVDEDLHHFFLDEGPAGVIHFNRDVELTGNMVGVGGRVVEHLDAAFGQANMRARFEVLSADPIVIIDGAHNPHGAKTAASTFAEAFTPFGRRMLVVGMMDEKDPVEMLTALDAKGAEIVVICQPNWPRAMPVAKLAAAARSMGIEPEVAENPADAIELATLLASEGDAIPGSLYVAGAVRDRLLD